MKNYGLTRANQQAAVFMFSPIDGRIIAYAGGKDYTESQYDRVQAIRPAGSAFKPITALAALEERTITKDELIDCNGIFDEIDPPIKCWAFPYDHGELNLEDAISNSCNVVFAKYGHFMSKDETGNYSTDIGLRVLQKYCRFSSSKT